MRKTVVLALAVGVTLAATPAHATVLTFERLGIAKESIIPAAYGDNVNPTCNSNGCCDAAGCYGMGNGFTPHITVSYRAIRTTSDAAIVGTLNFWDNDYGDLKNVAYAGAQDLMGEITLTPAPGYDVVLNGFDLGGWPKADVDSQVVRILELDGTVLMEFSPVKVKGNNASHTHIAPGRPIVSTVPLRILWGPDWRSGIDNVDFDEVETGTYDGCQLDAMCQEQLSETASLLLICEDSLAGCGAQVTSLTTQLAAANAQITQLKKDSDGDGRRDLDDLCPNTVRGSGVDVSGCSIEQFCGSFYVGNRYGQQQCAAADWKNDEPVMGSGQYDCKVVGGGRKSTTPAQCVPY